MPEGRRRIYWDACVTTSYLNGIEDRVPVLDAILQANRIPFADIELISSELSVVETAFTINEQRGKPLSEDELRKIDAFWADS